MRDPDRPDGGPDELVDERPAAEPEQPASPLRSNDDVVDGRERQLDPGVVSVQRIAGGILAAVVAVAGLFAIVPILLFGRMSGTGNGLFLVGWIAIVAFLLVTGLWWPAVRYRHTWYSLDEHELRIRRGVLWRSVSSVPRTRVQHTDVSQGPLERMYELATLVIYTAGTQHASVVLAGLPRDRAFRMRDRLIEAGPDDAV